MAKSTGAAASGGMAGKILVWLLAIACFGSLIFMLLILIIRFTSPATVPRLRLVQGVPLPGVLADRHGQLLDESLSSDRFDFQAYDPTTGLLFIAHPGPSAKKFQILEGIHAIPAGTRLQTSIAVFDTRHNQFVGSIISAPFVHGITIAANLHKVYAASAAAGFPSASNKIYVIDENTCKFAPSDQDACRVIKTITPAETPDSIGYDPDLQEVFVSEPGPSGNGVEQVINALTDQSIRTIHFGTAMGHVRYDPVSRLMFVVLTPSVTTKSEIAMIDPLTFNVQRFTLPPTCDGAHGLILDSQQQVGFAACTNSNNVVMFSLRTLQPVGDVQHLQSTGITPDVLDIDTNLHLLFVGSKTAISVYDESQASKGILRKLPRGDEVVANGDLHSIAVNDVTHTLYVPVTDMGSRPVLLIEHFDPQGNT
jgi:DNA-binding beta-propeller fold protein YncE